MQRLQASRALVVGIAVHLDGEVREYTEVPGAATEPYKIKVGQSVCLLERKAVLTCIEHLRVVDFGDLLLLSGVVDNLQREDVVSEKTKAASKLAVSSSLDMATQVHLEKLSAQSSRRFSPGAFSIYLCTLSMGDKNVVLAQKLAEFSQSPADARVDVALVALFEIGQVVRGAEGVAQVQLDVGRARRRSAAVLVAARSNRNRLLILLGIEDGPLDVFFAVWLHNQARLHVVVGCMGGRCVLVLPVRVLGRIGQELVPCHSLDCSHVEIDEGLQDRSRVTAGTMPLLKL